MQFDKKHKRILLSWLIVIFIISALTLVFSLYLDSIVSFYANNAAKLFERSKKYLPKLISVISVIIVGKALIFFIRLGFVKYSSIFHRDVKRSSAYKIIRYSIWVFILIAILSILVDNLSVFVASLGLAGFGVTFALQKPILNFVGWINIVFNRTYSIGDRVSVNNVRGDVIEIELMCTKLNGLLEKTDELSGKIVTIPNELVLTSPVINFTRSGQYLWEELEVTITYESNWQKGVKLLGEITTEVTDKYLKYAYEEKKQKETADLFRSLYLFDYKDKKDAVDEKQKEKHDQGMIDEHLENKPIVRVMLKDSAVALNVRYLAYYKKLMAMKSEINNMFLKKVEESDDLEIAYPHIQIVTKGKTR